jgi:Tol biopolymer transport system component
MVSKQSLVATLTTALLIVASSSAEAQTRLRWKFRPGETLRYGITMAMIEKAQLADKQPPMTITVGFAYDDAWKVKSVDKDGVATIDRTIDRMQMRVQGPQGRMGPQALLLEFDSAADKGAKTPMAAVFAQVAGAMVNKVAVLRINPRGEVLEAKPPQGLLEGLKKILPGVGSLGDSFGTAGLKNSQMNIQFPEQPVTKGQTWTHRDDFQLPMLMGSLSVEQKYEYLGAERRDRSEIQKIAITALLTSGEEKHAEARLGEGKPGQAKQAAPLVKFKGSGSSGTIYFDNAQGRILEGAMKLKMQAEINVMGKQATIDLGGSLRIKLQPAEPPARAAASKDGTRPTPPPTAAAAQKTTIPGNPLTLDLAPFYRDNKYVAGVFQSFLGRRVVDGLPFEIGGRVCLYGQTIAERNPKSALPETLKGIHVGRAFDELHLIHYTEWPDVEGQTIAYIALNYADGTRSILPIRYGVHVVDWFDLPSYAKELPTDPHTKVCWQRAPLRYKAPIRLFKSDLLNPWPGKTVETLDVISARRLTSYTLVAATVADRDPCWPVSLPPPATGPARKFDGKVTIKVVDDATGKPIEGALVEPTVDVVDEWVVGAPFYTSSAGEGTIPYRVKETSRMVAEIKKEGYLPKWEDWQGNIPSSFTFRLVPAGGGPENRQGSIRGTLEGWFSGAAKPQAAPVATGVIRPLFLIDADGSHLQPLVSIPEYTACGSPEWSRDGSKIAFDAWRSAQGESCAQGHVFVAAVDGSWVEDLGPGGMPSWSPDGREIAFSHWRPESGVSIMNADGSDRQLLDADGWGAEWSPRRNEIAYVISRAGGQKLCIYDVDSKDCRTLLGTKSFRHIRQGFAWSPDGEYLCFKGILPGCAPQFAVVHREGVPLGFKVLLPSAEMPNVGASGTTVSWGGNGNQILLSVRGKTDRSVQIYVVDFMGMQPPKLLSGQDPQRDNIDAAWSPDGKRTAFAGSAAAMAPPLPAASPGRTEVKTQREMVHGMRPRGNCSLSGKVVAAATGKPIAHATMYLFYLPTHAATFIDVAGDGTFIFTDIPTGPFLLRATHVPGYQDAVYNPDGMPGPLAAFSLKDGEQRAGIVLNAKPACRVSGRIVGENGKIPENINDLTVLAWFAKNDGKEYESQQARVNRADGSYLIDGLGNRPVYVMAINWHAAKQGNASPPIYYPGTFFRNDAKRITFDKGECVGNIDIQLKKEGGLILEGTVHDEAGKPVPEAFVVVHRRDMLFDFVTAYTDPQGRYQIQGLGDGRFLAHVDAVQRGLVRTRTPIDLDRAHPRTRLDFTLKRGVAISGKFVDEKGNDWQIGQSHGFAKVTGKGCQQSSSCFSLTNFRNKYRPKDVLESSGGEFAPGEGDYDDGHMIFPTKSTFILQGMMPGYTMIGFSPQKEGQKVVKILHDGQGIMKSGITTPFGQEIDNVLSYFLPSVRTAGITTQPGQDVKDVTIVVGARSAAAAGPAGEKQ